MRHPRTWPQWTEHKAGHVVIPAAVLLVAIAALTGGLYDLRNLHMQRQHLKAAANAAVLEGVRALDYPETTRARVEFSAMAEVASRLGETRFDTRAQIDSRRNRLEIAIEAPAKVRFPGPLSLIRTVSVVSGAELVATAGKLCMLARPDAATGATGSITVGERAVVEAGDCVLHSDRASGKAVSMAKTARVSARALHRAAGDDHARAADGPDTNSQPGLRLVAQRGDPLADRPAPGFNPLECDARDLVVTGHETLSEGVYCGGLTIDGGTADLFAGTYVLVDGPLRITGGGRLRGEFVGFYLAGEAAVLDITAESDMALTAPRTGEMAGLMVRSAPAPEDAAGQRRKRRHRLASENARRLSGTIYLPGDRLDIGSDGPMAGQSDYTVLIAGEIVVPDGAHLTLNADHDGSLSPLPGELSRPVNAVATLVEPPQG